MPREYRHIEMYEKEIIQHWEQGKTLREIGEQLGFTHKQVQEFKTRYNRKQKKIALGIAIKKKGRP
ncbi:MAG: imidazolonepropionase, partial [Clostridia bacterium]|nr:imidazolonepropionase [Clostridia bacterium]